MSVNPVPVAGPYPIKFDKREAKVIETARSGLAVLSSLGALASLNQVALAQLAAGVAPSHVVKFIRTAITGSALVGVAVGDICVRWIAASGLVSVMPAVSVDTVPQTLAPADYVIVFRVAV